MYVHGIRLCRQLTFVAEMSGSLQERFFYSLKPLCSILPLTGIYLFRVKWSSNTTQLSYAWSLFWTLLCFQSSFFIAVERMCLLVPSRFLSCSGVSGIFKELVNVLLRLSELVGNTIIHIVLVSTVQSTVTVLVSKLNQVDKDLNRPNLKCIGRISLVGFIYLTFSVRFIIVLLVDLLS